jgi:predicted HicB family RNase H-like nuclease
MKDLMEYKGYYGSVHYSDDDQVFHGKIEFIRSLVSYEGTDVKGLRTAFKGSNAHTNWEVLTASR